MGETDSKNREPRETDSKVRVDWKRKAVERNKEPGETDCGIGILSGVQQHVAATADGKLSRSIRVLNV